MLRCRVPLRFPVAVHIFFVRGESVLLLRRCHTGYEDGKLSVVAGHVEPGETVTQAACRESREEVGLDLPPERLHVVGVMHRKSGDERIDFFLACRLETEEEPRNAEAHKCSELIWAVVGHLPGDTIPYVRAALENYRSGRWFQEFGWSAEDARMAKVRALHDAVKHGNCGSIRNLLDQERDLVNSLSATDARGTLPLHVAAEFGQADAARVLLAYGADLSRLDAENDATALGWAAFFGRPAVVAVLLEGGADPSQRNRHGLTPLGCATGGIEGKWAPFSDAAIDDWRRAADLIRARGGAE
jgi:8-oxo-dGTP diphosphatase